MPVAQKRRRPELTAEAVHHELLAVVHRGRAVVVLVPAHSGVACLVLGRMDVVHRAVGPPVPVASHQLLHFLQERRVRAELAEVLVAHDVAPNAPAQAGRGLGPREVVPLPDERVAVGD